MHLHNISGCIGDNILLEFSVMSAMVWELILVVLYLESRKVSATIQENNLLD
jgi:hypothetical protein